MPSQADKDAMAMIWGGGGKVADRKKQGQKGGRKRKAVDAELDDEGNAIGEVPSDEEDGEGKQRRVLSRAKRAKISSKQDERDRTVHVHIDRTAERNDVRTLLEDYDPKVTVQKYQNPKAKGHFALIIFKTRAMAEHAIERFNGTNQKDLLGVEDLKIGFVKSRRENKRCTERKNKVTKAIKKAKWMASKQD